MHLIEGCTAQGYNRRKRRWRDRLALDRRGFVERVRDQLGIRGRYRAIEKHGQHHLRRAGFEGYVPAFGGESASLSRQYA